jgi:ParB/RepB/Spo0J family partition protein
MKVIQELEVLLEPLSETQYYELKQSIHEKSQQVPITVGYLRDNPDELFIVDGHNRYRACLELGIEPLVSKPIGYKTMAKVKLVMLDINNLRRRKLTKFEIKETLKKLYVSGKLNKHGRPSEKGINDTLKSLPELAAELGTSTPTLKRELARIKATDELAGIIDDKSVQTLESMNDKQFAAAVSGIAAINKATNTDELDKGIDELAKTAFTSKEISKFAEMRQQNAEFGEQMKEARQLQQEIKVKKRIESATSHIIELLDGYGEAEVISAVILNITQHYSTL